MYVSAKHSIRPSVPSATDDWYAVRWTTSCSRCTSGIVTFCVRPNAAIEATTVIASQVAPLRMATTLAPSICAQSVSMTEICTRASAVMSLCAPSSKKTRRERVAELATPMPAALAPSLGDASRCWEAWRVAEDGLGTSTCTVLAALASSCPHEVHSVKSRRPHEAVAPIGTDAVQNPAEVGAAVTRSDGASDVMLSSSMPEAAVYGTSSASPSLHSTRAKMRPLAPSASRA